MRASGRIGPGGETLGIWPGCFIWPSKDRGTTRPSGTAKKTEDVVATVTDRGRWRPTGIAIPGPTGWTLTMAIRQRSHRVGDPECTRKGASWAGWLRLFLMAWIVFAWSGCPKSAEPRPFPPPKAWPDELVLKADERRILPRRHWGDGISAGDQWIGMWRDGLLCVRKSPMH